MKELMLYAWLTSTAGLTFSIVTHYRYVIKKVSKK